MEEIDPVKDREISTNKPADNEIIQTSIGSSNTTDSLPELTCIDRVFGTQNISVPSLPPCGNVEKLLPSAVPDFDVSNESEHFIDSPSSVGDMF